MKQERGRDEVTLDDAIAAVRDDEAPAAVGGRGRGAGVGAARPARSDGRGAAIEAIRGCADVQALLPGVSRRRASGGARAPGRGPPARVRGLPGGVPRAARRRGWPSCRGVAASRAAKPAAARASRRLRRRRRRCCWPPASPAGRVRQALLRRAPGQPRRGAVGERGAAARRRAAGAAARARRGARRGRGRAHGARLAGRAAAARRLDRRDERAGRAVGDRPRPGHHHPPRARQHHRRRRRSAAPGTCCVASQRLHGPGHGHRVLGEPRPQGLARVGPRGPGPGGPRAARRQVLAPGEQWTTSDGRGRGAAARRDRLEPRRGPAPGAAGRVQGAAREVAAPCAMPGRALREPPAALRARATRWSSRALPNYGEALAEAHRLFEERLQESAGAARVVATGRPGAPRRAEPRRESSRGSGASPSSWATRSSSRPWTKDARADVVPCCWPRSAGPGCGSSWRRSWPRRPTGRPARGPDPRTRTSLGAGAEQGRALRAAAARAHRGGAGRDGAARAGRSARERRRRPRRHAVRRSASPRPTRTASGSCSRPTSSASTAAIARHGGRRDPQQEALRRAGLDGAALPRLRAQGRRRARPDPGRARLRAARARGIASWLAAPAPMGSLDFVSPHAQAAAAFVFKSPALVFDDVVGLVTAGRRRARARSWPSWSRSWTCASARTWPTTLGGEFALALDGPLLPTPAWKLVVEVYDPARLQASLERPGEPRERRGGARRAARPAAGGRAGRAARRTHVAAAASCRSSCTTPSPDGYLVAAPSRALVMRAIQHARVGRDAGRLGGLPRPVPARPRRARLGARVPEPGPMVRSLLRRAGVGPLTRRAAAARSRPWPRDAKPTLLCAYGEEDGIRVAGMRRRPRPRPARPGAARCCWSARCRRTAAATGGLRRAGAMPPVIELDGLVVRLGGRTDPRRADRRALRPRHRPARARTARASRRSSTRCSASTRRPRAPRASSAATSARPKALRRLDRLHARERRLHRRHERRALRPLHGRAGRACRRSRRSSAPTRPSSTWAWARPATASSAPTRWA